MRKRSLSPMQMSAIWRVRSTASAMPPPRKAATPGLAALAAAPRPQHSTSAESPMSGAASSSDMPGAVERVAHQRRRAP